MSIELAATAVGFLVPYLAEAGKEAAKTVGSKTADTAIKVLGWMREKMTGRAKEALDDLELSATPCHDSCHAPSNDARLDAVVRQGFCTAELGRSLGQGGAAARRRWRAPHRALRWGRPPGTGAPPTARSPDQSRPPGSAGRYCTRPSSSPHHCPARGHRV